MSAEKTNIKDVIEERSPAKREEKYNEYVKENTPKKSWLLNLCKAFVVGGLICTLGQLFIDLYGMVGVDKETAALYNTLSLIFLSILFTGLNLYQKLANFAGAGTLVPITGFANSVAAPAIEFKEEGQVFGIGCKIFTIAGPVILYGVVCSWGLGILYWLGKMMGIV
ncbi:MAG: stage V sporulation protein AC [Lachnospiraceae bacterium]|nr:stage V sporulation protein AC [Lachnospiraceae bacterium]